MKGSNTIRHHLVLQLVMAVAALLLLPSPLTAITRRDADMAYKKANYQQAITDYKTLLTQGKSAALYYNLGNSYYRSDSLAQAILAYERAALLSPGDKDINFNLQFARSKTIDKVTPEGEVIFVTWYRSLVNLTSADRWAVIGIVSVALALVLMLVYLFTSRIGLRKVGFFGALAFLLLFGASTLFAHTQKEAMTHRTGAIVIAPSAGVKKSPVKGAADDFVLHEGTRVEVTDGSIGSWRAIRLADGREGWLDASQIEMI
jgi:tetratricopeptide (TPR) repeat protein